MKTGYKVLIGLGIVVFLTSIFGVKKAKEMQILFSKLTIKPLNFRNFSGNLKTIKFYCDVVLKNPTDIDFEVNGYLIKLTQLNFYYDGKFLATSYQNITDISIPANNELLLKNILVEVNVINALQNANELYNFSYDKLTVEAIVNVAGYNITLKQ